MPPFDLTPLFNYGPIGIILGWYLWSVSPRLDRIERAIDRSTRAQMLVLIANTSVSEAMREQARSINRSIERRYKIDADGSEEV